MARLLLDSTVLIDVLRGRPAAQHVQDLRRKGIEPWVCVISVEEIWRGTFPAEEAAVARLFRGVRLARLANAEGERAGRWRRQFAERGVTLQQADCLIAAACVGISADLATGNPDDFPMPEVTVRHWPPGS